MLHDLLYSCIIFDSECKILSYVRSVSFLSQLVVWAATSVYCCMDLHVFCLSKTPFGDAAFRLCSVRQTQMILWQKTLQKNGEMMRQRLCKQVQPVTTPAVHNNFAASDDNFLCAAAAKEWTRLYATSPWKHMTATPVARKSHTTLVSNFCGLTR